jgi:hypothetical protein
MFSRQTLPQTGLVVQFLFGCTAAPFSLGLAVFLAMTGLTLQGEIIKTAIVVTAR